MSNRVVSSTYRTIIDDVIANVRQDFEDMGIEKEVLEELQRSWEAKIVATQVADFEGAPPVSNGAGRGQSPKSAAPPKIETKPETVDPETDGARTNGTGPPSAKSARTHGATDASSGRDYNQQPSATGSGASQAAAAAAGEVGVGDKRKRVSADDEIGSDLDDSDEEDGEGAGEGDGNEDMVLCLYDKVQRVKNKWKCVLKDGVASIDGRDYLFTKCNGEFEW